jgi:hypothetical protein
MPLCERSENCAEKAENTQQMISNLMLLKMKSSDKGDRFSAEKRAFGTNLAHLRSETSTIYLLCKVFFLL